MVNSVKEFFASIVDASKNDFVVSCCICTQDVLDSHPDKLFVIAKNPVVISGRCPGCTYDRVRSVFDVNIKDKRTSIPVAVVGEHIFSRTFGMIAVRDLHYASSGVPVMSEETFSIMCLYATSSRRALQEKFLKYQDVDLVVKLYVASRCGKSVYPAWLRVDARKRN